MSRLRKLTPAEWQIMDAIWELGGAPAVREVLEHAFPGGDRAYTTVQTIMNTLVGKRLLRRRKKGLVNFYAPTRSKDEMARSETSSLLERVFDGSAPALANSLLSLEGLSLQEIRQIKELLADKERELEGDAS